MQFVPFDKLEAATQTVVAKVDITIELDLLFDLLPCLENGKYKVIDDLSQPDPNAWIEPGTIIRLDFKNDSRGNKVRPDPNINKDSASFKNAVIVNMYLGPHCVRNFKVSPHGKFQLTGCKDNSQFVLPVLFFVRAIHRMPQRDNVIGRLNNDCYHLWFVVVMRNIYFNLPKPLSLDNLSVHILRTDNITEPKFDPTYSRVHSPSLQIKYKPSAQHDNGIPYLLVTDKSLDTGDYSRAIILPKLAMDSTDNLLSVLTEDEEKRLFRCKSFSLIVYETGKVFMSGRGTELGVAYMDFCDMIKQYYLKHKDICDIHWKRRGKKSASSITTLSDETQESTVKILHKLQQMRMKNIKLRTSI